MFRPALIILALVLGGCASTYHERYRYYADAGHGDYYYEPSPRYHGGIGLYAGYYDPFWSVGFHPGPWYPYRGWGHVGWYGPSWGWGYWGGYRPWWSGGYGYWDRHYAWNWHWWHHTQPHRSGPRRDLRGRVQDTVRGPTHSGRPVRAWTQTRPAAGDTRSANRTMVPDRRPRPATPAMRPRPSPMTPPSRGAERGWQRPSSPAGARPIPSRPPVRGDHGAVRDLVHPRAQQQAAPMRSVPPPVRGAGRWHHADAPTARSAPSIPAARAASAMPAAQPPPPQRAPNPPSVSRPAAPTQSAPAQSRPTPTPRAAPEIRSGRAESAGGGARSRALDHRR